MGLPPLLSRESLDENTVADIARDCNVPVEAIQDVYACSPLQLATMFESTMRAGTSTFQFVFSLGPAVEEGRFAKALQQVVSENAILHTRIVDNPTVGIVQVVLIEDCAPRRPADTSLDHFIMKNKNEPMGMGLPLFASAIVDHKLILSMHHAVMDHAAMTLLMTDVFQLYHGQCPIPRTPYKDFVIHCLGVDQSAAEAFWAPRFKGHPAIFPTVPSGHVPRAEQMLRQSLVLAPNVTDDAIPHISSFIEAAFGLTLAAYTRNDHVVFGLVLAGRKAFSDRLGSTLGPTIATIPIQINVQPNLKVADVVRERATARRQLQTNPALHVGLPRIRNASEAAGFASHFQAILNIRPSLADADSAIGDLTFDHMHEPSAPFGLSLSCNLASSCREMLLEIHFDPGILIERQVQNFLNQFEHHLNSLTQANWETPLKALSSLNSYDRVQILEWNTNIDPPVNQCLHELFHARATQQPLATAVEAADGQATYAQLDAISTRVARELRRKGIGRGSSVPFIFEKSLWAIVAIFAIMKSGAACVPIERNDPDARKMDIIRRVGATMIITSYQERSRSVDLAENVLVLGAATVEQLSDPPDESTDANSDAVTPEDLAIILFTSGSTGTPKGVLLEHRCLATSLTALSKSLGWCSGRRVLQFASYVWDCSLGEIFGALLFGGCLCVPSEEERLSALTRFIQASNVDWAILTPTVLRTLSRTEIRSLRTLVSAGEAIGDDIIASWGNGSICLLNGWGPCETSFLSALANVRSDPLYRDSIGVPMGCALWIVNPDNVNELVPIGCAGEICVEGSGVARGYLRDSGGKGGSAFIQPPVWAPERSGKTTRFFRTGDLARYNPDGSISYIGRRDQQVKVRGQRFDCGELEAAILSSGYAREAFVTTKINVGRTEVVAVFALSNDSLPNKLPPSVLTGDAAERAGPLTSAIEAHLRSKLPSYMIPTILIATEQLPRTVSAKLDRMKVRDWVKTQDLKSIKSNTTVAPHTLTTPATEDEGVLQTVWASVLEIEPQDIGRESVFLQLGGDSIRAMQAAGLLRKHGYDTPIGSLLSNDTLAKIAAAAKSTSNLSDSQERWSSPATTPSLSLPFSYTVGMNIESLAPATDVQAAMLAVGQKRANGYHVNFWLAFEPGVGFAQLRAACDTVIRHHPILRTVFIQYSSNLYQAVLGCETNTQQLNAIENDQGLPPPTDFVDGKPLARFDLLVKEGVCHRLRLDLHHALYDAISLNLIFADLRAAFSGETLSSGPDFHSWITQLEDQDCTASYSFWKETLKDSKMSYLVSPPPGPVCGSALDGQIHFNAPLIAREGQVVGTAPSVVKAAWALVLSYALQLDDVIFGEVTASRFDSLAGMDQVRGPCVNTVPVRAKLEMCNSLASIIAQIHELSRLGMPHHRLGYSKVIRQCTDWPAWTRFSSTLVYQTPGLLDHKFNIGDSKVTLTHDGRVGDSADLWIIATPFGIKELNIELNFALNVVSAKLGEWIAQCLTLVLEEISRNPNQTVEDVHDHLRNKAGAFVMPECSPARIALQLPKGSATENAWHVVSLAWDEVGLLPVAKGEHVKNDVKNDSSTMADNGGDVVTCLLLSQYYGRHGYNTPVEDIVRRPTRALQASLLDERKMLVVTSTDGQGSLRR